MIYMSTPPEILATRVLGQNSESLFITTNGQPVNKKKRIPPRIFKQVSISRKFFFFCTVSYYSKRLNKIIVRKCIHKAEQMTRRWKYKEAEINATE